MRLLLVVLCIALLGVTGWHAVHVGTDNGHLAGAPQIERMVDRGVRAGLEDISGPEVTVDTDGRNVTLTGPVAGEEKRNAILEAARQTYLLGRLEDRLEVLDTVSPFTFSAERAADGQILLAGHVPDRATEDNLLAQARAIAGGADVQSDLKVAAGAPGADWPLVAVTGVTALSEMQEGRFALSDLDAELTGRVADKAAADVIGDVTNLAPSANWTLTLDGAEIGAEPYVFSALKTADGAIIVSGAAPDEATAQALRSAAAEAGSTTVEGELQITEGMPDPSWPDRVTRGLAALARTEAGLLMVTDMAVQLTGDVDTNDDLAALLPETAEDWTTNLTVLNPPPQADVTILMDTDSNLQASGVLPDGLDAGSFATMLPGLDVAGLDLDQVGGAADWTDAAEALNIVLPRLETATARIGEQELAISGVLRRGFSAEGSIAAVETVMPDQWVLDLDLRESAPLSGVVFSKRDAELVLSGVLPQGLTEEEALSLAGDAASGEALATAGAGDPEAWRGVLSGLTAGLDPFTSATGEVTEGSIAIDGTLKPGYGANEVQTWLSGQLSGDWDVALSATETAPSEGDARRNLETDESEKFRSGYWLPDVDFAVSPEACKAEIDQALAREPIRFVTGSARIDDEGRALLNRLAAVAVRCLNSSIMRLEIEGHTDAQGNDASNQALSERRAEAVRVALADRGVRPDAMTTRGYGETRPIDTNNTAEGRAKNRRIEFVWSAGGN